MNPAQMLSAPQAGLMATVAQGVYSHNLQWTMIGVGALIALVCIIIDEILKRYGTRLPVLAVGLAIYLPMSTTVPVVIGGFLSYFIQMSLNNRVKRGMASEQEATTHRHRGLLLTCGIVAGASIMGVVLAIPFAIKQSADALKIMPDQYAYLTGGLSILVTVILCGWICRYIMKK
jgi:putative OPT family oligopeptide transporter